MKPREKTWLLAVLTALLVIATGIIVFERIHRLVPWWTIGVVATPWLAISLVLRARPDDWGFEGKYVDWWSIPHFMAGGLFALLGVGIAFVIPIAITWELVEVFSRVKEKPGNRVMDVVLATAGWLIANAIWRGGFPLA